MEKISEKSRKDLNKLAKDLKIKNYSKLKKAELVNLIVELQSKKDKVEEVKVNKVEKTEVKQEVKPAKVEKKVVSNVIKTQKKVFIEANYDYQNVFSEGYVGEKYSPAFL